LFLPMPAVRGTILLVEDEAMVRTLTRTILEDVGYEVMEAADCEEAIRLCREHGGEIDLLLTDVVMSLMSGKQLAEHITPLCPRAKVFYMSGYTDDAIFHHGVLDPGTPLLEKPFTPAAVICKVREVLDA
jgi:two-component system, cell cycle sensor histidine kinase and response regulator CckA